MTCFQKKKLINKAEHSHKAVCHITQNILQKCWFINGDLILVYNSAAFTTEKKNFPSLRTAVQVEILSIEKSYTAVTEG